VIKNLSQNHQKKIFYDPQSPDALDCQVFAVIMGIGVGLHTISYFEKTGSQPSVFWLFAVLIGFPTVGIIIFLKKRSSIIKSMSDPTSDLQAKS